MKIILHWILIQNAKTLTCLPTGQDAVETVVRSINET